MTSYDDISIEETLNKIYHAILACGYDPIKQFSGYILSEDPTYIPDYDNARGMIRHIDRDELLRFLIRHYFEQEA